MPKSTCSINGCDKPTAGRGWCSAHYQRWSNHGDPLGGKPSPSVLKAMDHEDGTRTCSTCQNKQPIENYYRDKSATLGRRSKCKTCVLAHMKTWYDDNQERQMIRARERAARDIDKIRRNDKARYERSKDKRIALVVEHGHKRRALMAGAVGVKGITVAALRKIHGDNCCYCGTAMLFVRARRGTFIPTKATVEHVQALSRGGAHDWPNVTLACWQCNVRKNAKPVEQWLAQQ